MLYFRKLVVRFGKWKPNQNFLQTSRMKIKEYLHLRTYLKTLLLSLEITFVLAKFLVYLLNLGLKLNLDIYICCKYIHTYQCINIFTNIYIYREIWYWDYTQKIPM